VTPVLTVGCFFSFTNKGVEPQSSWQIIDQQGDNFRIQKFEYENPVLPSFYANAQMIQHQLNKGEFYIISSGSDFEVLT
jgi:hypothetical protein